ncbi:MAG: DUF814 domain-containing protein, partial [Candidatus Wallbacteria bacterium]|nr:DUF814 domain-containing protein [Candidatus Wallbacteria bacterium]
GVDPAVVPWMPAAPLPPGARLFESPSEAVEAYLGEGVGKMRLSRLRDELLGSLRRRRVRLEQRLERFLEDQERAREADLFERWGHLLQANPQAAGPYDSSAKLRDLFEPDAPEIEIPLRPGHTLAASAASLFNRARRLRRTAPAARLAEMGCRAELELVEQWSRDILRIADDARAAPQDALADLRLAAARIRDAGVSAEVPAAGKSGGRGRGRRQERPRFREFRSSDGLRILAGRTDRENDQLTTRAARRGDLWLHVHDAPGAHVVVKLAGAECPRATLVEAAQIAAFYSPNRYSAKATVAYTRSENVKKPPGARPGLVTLRSFQTLVVACDASVPAKLSGLRPNGAADAT